MVAWGQYALTARQANLLRFLSSYQAASGGVSPSFRECFDAVGSRSLGVVLRALDALERRGAIRRLPNRARAIEILAPAIASCAPDGAPLFFIPAGSLPGRRRGQVETTAPATSVLAPVHGTLLSHV